MRNCIKISTAFCVLITLTKFQSIIGYEVVYAVNCGGGAQIGSNGINYEADPGSCDNNDTQVVDHGIVGGLPYSDGIIFQHQRCHYNPFTYEVPVLDDGKYVLILKFFEPKQPPANIEDHRHICGTVNGIKIIYDLDISNEFGCSIPVEVHRVLWVKDGRLFYKSQSTGIKYKKLHITVSKIYNAYASLCGLLFIRLDDENEVFPKKSWLAKPVRKKYAGTCNVKLSELLKNEIKKQAKEVFDYYDDTMSSPVVQDEQPKQLTTTTTTTPTTILSQITSSVEQIRSRPNLVAQASPTESPDEPNGTNVTQSFKNETNQQAGEEDKRKAEDDKRESIKENGKTNENEKETEKKKTEKDEEAEKYSKKKADEEAKKEEEDKKKADQKKAEEDKKEAEKEKKRKEEEEKEMKKSKKEAEENSKKIEASKKKADEQAKKVEEDKKKADKKKAEEDKKEAEKEKNRKEEEEKEMKKNKKEAEENSKKIEASKKKADEQAKKVEEDRKKADKKKAEEAKKMAEAAKKAAAKPNQKSSKKQK
jgi:hypothetical protein